MMTPMHTDLAKHLPATHAAPGDHERTAFRTRRTARLAAFREALAWIVARRPRPAAPRAGQVTPAE